MFNIAPLRLASQHISTGHHPSAAAVVSALGAVQAQDYVSALWAIGVRLAGGRLSQEKSLAENIVIPAKAGIQQKKNSAKRDKTKVLSASREELNQLDSRFRGNDGSDGLSGLSDVTRAIAERHIVRTWAMRGTIHFLAAADVRWMLQLIAPRLLANTSRRDTQLELNDAIYAQSRVLLEKALQGGQQLTREEVYAVLERGKISTEGQRGYHILWHLGLSGVICFGAHKGKQPTFVLLDEWIPPSPALSREDALTKLTLRYFNSRGPATVQDFANWAKLSLTEARVGLASAAPELQQFTQADVTYWMSKTLTEIDDDETAFLLPAFDEYLLGYKDRSAVLAAEHAYKVVPGGNGMFLPMMVLDGKIVGTWKRTLKKKSVLIDYAPFGKLKKSERAMFEVAAQRYGEFLGLKVE